MLYPEQNHSFRLLTLFLFSFSISERQGKASEKFFLNLHDFIIFKTSEPQDLQLQLVAVTQISICNDGKD